VPACLIERCEHEAAQILAPLAHATQNSQIVFVELLLRSVVARFVAAESEDEEVDTAPFELSLDVRLVVVEQAVRACAEQAERVVHHARAFALDDDSVEMDRTASSVTKLDHVRSVGRFDRIDIVAKRVGLGRYDLPFPSVEPHGELSASRLRLVVDVESGRIPTDVASFRSADSRPRASARPRLHAPVAVPPVAVLTAHHLANFPGFGVGGLPDASVFVGDVAFGGENEAVASVPEARLEVLSHGRRDEIGSDARVPVVPDPRDCAFLSPRGPLERLIECAHPAPRRVFDVDCNACVLRRGDLRSVVGLNWRCHHWSWAKVSRHGLAHGLRKALGPGLCVGRRAIGAPVAGERRNRPPSIEEPHDGEAFLTRNPWSHPFHGRDHVRQCARGEHEHRHRDQVLQRREVAVDSFEHQNWK